MTKPLRSVVGVIVLLLFVSAAAESAEQQVRHFRIRYSAAVTGVDTGAKAVRVWLPCPQSDPWQTIDHVSIDASYPHTVTKDPEYGNSILYLAGAPPADGTVNVAMTFDVTRREYVNRPGGAAAAPKDRDDERLIERFRKPDHLIPLEGKIAEVAREAAGQAHLGGGEPGTGPWPRPAGPRRPRR